MNIDWTSQQSHVMLSKFENKKEKSDDPFKHAWPELKAHVWVASSGSESSPKWIALSKEAFLNSAQAVNQHLESQKQDRWLNILPVFHVGGLSIHARAFLQGNTVIDLSHKPWSPEDFYKTLEKEKITLTSLVPTQVYDLVHLKKKSPPHLRAVVVGGGHMSETMYKAARALEWPVLPSYGLTETCSQVATADLSTLKNNEYPSLRILSHAQIQALGDGTLKVKSSSLLTGLYQRQNGDWIFEDPKQNGWLETTDTGVVQSGCVSGIQRRSRVVKINGVLVSLDDVQNRWQSFLSAQNVSSHSQLMAVKDSRREHRIVLVCALADWKRLSDLAPTFFENLTGLERPAEVYALTEFPHHPMGKWPTDWVLRRLGY